MMRQIAELLNEGRDVSAHLLSGSIAHSWLKEASARQLDDEKRLAKILRAAAGLDGYRGLLPGKIATKDAWRIYADLAPISKKNVRGKERDFSSRYGLSASTSGTTGTPLRLLRSPFSVLMEEAWVGHCRGWAKYRGNEPSVIMRGATFSDGQSPVPHKGTQGNHHLEISSYHLSDATIVEYLRLIRQHKTRWIVAYPSSIASLTILCLRRGLEIPQISGIFTSSETLTPQVRLTVETAWGCKIWDHYGNAERTVAAAQCEAGRYHILPGYAIVEKVPGGLLTTSLLNRAMPLVKYEVTDRLEDWSEKTCVCGRIGPTVAAVTGREEDIIFGLDGRRIGRLDHVLKGVRGILAGQFVQEESGSITLRVVPTHDGPTADYENDLQARVIERTGPIQVSIELCSELERRPNGKVPFVIQRLQEA